MKKIYVAINGNDRWSGTRPAPNAARTDGPFATIEAAQRAVRRLKNKDGLPEPVTVYVRGGQYLLTRPLVFTAADSGTPSRPVQDPNNAWAATAACPLVYRAYRGEKPVFSGGRVITGWRPARLNGKTVWRASVPELKTGRWYFRQLWVNGKRAVRPVRPRTGFYRVEKPVGKPADPIGWYGGHRAFVARPGHIRAWANLADVEVAVYNYWIESRMRITAFDPRTRRVTLDRPCRTHLVDEWGKQGAQYRVVGALDSLDKPGQWCLDRRAGRVYYLPRAGERIATAQIIAAGLPHLVRIEGSDPEKGAVQLVTFKGLDFAHSEWLPPKDYAGSGQAASDVPGAVVLKNARDISFVDCCFQHLGSYGVECASGCFGVALTGCRITDLGAGGVKVWHGNNRITVSDCRIAHGGRLYGQACAVLAGQASGVVIVHNHIHDFYYTGISLGWHWGYREGRAYGNVVEYNHVHNLGRGLLSDMGCVYTLGPQPGTRIRYNLFHDVDSRTYGGWGIYTDEGSSDILIENNLVYNTKCGGFHQHYGAGNAVQNNIFAFSQENQLARTRPEKHLSFTFQRNLVLIDRGVFWRGVWEKGRALIDNNLYWDYRFGRRPPAPARMGMVGKNQPNVAGGERSAFSLAWWRVRGHDRHSLIADPGFRKPRKGDFTLRPGSAARRIGFVPFSLDSVGPRRKRARP